MLNAVKNFSVGYNPNNKSNTFTSGDYLTGTITLDLAEDCKINSLCVKLKGKAKVKWVESYGRTIVVYHAKEKYFSIKQFIIQEGKSNVGQGSHVYPFTLQFPEQDLPSSFRDKKGKILYKLEANLSRPMSMDSKAKAQLTFISKTNLNTPPGSLCYDNVKDKTMKLFTSGTVAMDVNIDRMGFYQGEDIKVVAFIQNRSSREIKPKYRLYRKHSFFSKLKRKVETKELLKEVGEPVPPSVSQTVTRIITIPPAADPSILNCNLIKAEYRLRVCILKQRLSKMSAPECMVVVVSLESSGVEEAGRHDGQCKRKQE
uniref:Zgc:110626 n=1 Tax=Myripristis murdjan TaxID=586833 RepID=A0A667ZFJ9_9TELE